MNGKFIDVNNLTKTFERKKGLMKKTVASVKAVDDISFHIFRGETLGLVGESGCGKTTTGRSILRAIEPTAGSIEYNFSDGSKVDIRRMPKKELRSIRHKMGLIFQDPYSSLNPRMNILDTVSEPLVIAKHTTSRKATEDRVAELLSKVGLDPLYMRRYPHAFSGGQRQRIAIARELSMNPEFIVCDEPVSALDVSVQAQVLNLLKELQDELGLTFLFVAHDLAVVEYISDRIAVMYVGRIMELCETEELLNNPMHPYTEALLKAVPTGKPEDNLLDNFELTGEVADPGNPPSGCHFHPRCTYAKDICMQERPQLTPVKGSEGHFCACHFKDSLTLNGASTR
ncbi:MAG: ABC transporter ATP-binding protein [bacterium]|nr:ABC transporter ATP-binding protein [bacterium]